MGEARDHRSTPRGENGRLRGPVLLLGGSGMLGGAWRSLLDAEGVPYEAPTSKELDLTDEGAIRAHVNGRYGTIVNCAGWTDVDGAEEHEEEAFVLNAEAPRVLAEQASRSGALLVHYSTDYVFRGMADVPYRVCHTLDPVNAYGRSKARGEQAVFHSRACSLVVRTSWLYAPWGRNFVRTMLGLVQSRPRVRVVDDQVGRPTSCEWLAEATARLVGHGRRGVWHVCDGGHCSWHELAREIAAHVGASCVVEPCSSEEFPRPAARPAYSVLDLSSTDRVLGPPAEWRANVRAVLARITAGKEATAA